MNDMVPHRLPKANCSILNELPYCHGLKVIADGGCQKPTLHTSQVENRHFTSATIHLINTRSWSTQTYYVICEHFSVMH